MQKQRLREVNCRKIIRILLLSYIKSKDLTFEEFNYEIINFDFGFSEIGDKFGPIHESVFTGNGKCKLKYNAAQLKLSLRLLPFLLSNFVDQSTAYYTFLIQIVEICQILFSPVISKGIVTALESPIEEHLKLFQQLFSSKNITPKQPYCIHIPSHIITLGPPTRAPCFSFESAHNYFKELARKQNFKNFAFSSGKSDQRMECCNFINNQLTPESHPLFVTEKTFGFIKLMEDNETADIRKKIQRSGLLPGLF